MAINPNELFYRGYNPAALVAGYDDTWAVESYREAPVRKTAPAPAPANVKKEEKSGGALQWGYFGENGPRGKQRPMTRNVSFQDEKPGNGGAALQSRSGYFGENGPRGKPLNESVQEENIGKGGAKVHSENFGENGPRGKPSPVTRIASLQERTNTYSGFGGNWFTGRRPAVTRTPLLQDPKAVLEKKGIVELRMPLCCEGCVERVQKKFKSLKGVASVECSQEKQKVVVRGSATPEEVLKRAQATLSRSSFWEEEAIPPQ
ncbi:hypothetical protein AXG93_3137s1080 [Marchantia polymorpha subsp. ruderalis]|uniref:HMA domain-containing protein n=1 Tax=Marchantia polymorpha subsp. ruderalis TaxID=1480154 RepID=A0A176W3Q2_MARPO|nr:hypothetical protein AXG93_3137s1080 [Marchantia polymorpha subsp. ruderalis]